MRLFTRPLARRSAVIVGLVVTIGFVTASPAVAATGSGSGATGYFVPTFGAPSFPPPCVEMEELAWQQTLSSGTYSATSGMATASYTGPITLNTLLGNEGPYYEGPDGTHGTDAGCDSTDPGEPWTDILATTSGTNSQGSTVYCTFTGGEYSRVDLDISVDDLSGSCTIDENGTDGNDTVTNSPTTEDRTADLDECFGEENAPPDYCTTVSGTYSGS